MTNLLNLVKNQFSPTVVDSISNLLGVDNQIGKSAINTFAPASLNGVIHKGSSREGAASIIELFDEFDLGQNLLDNLDESLSTTDSRMKLFEKGARLSLAVFADNEPSLLDHLSAYSGLSRKNSGKLLSLILPIVMSVVQKVYTDEDSGAAGLATLLGRNHAEVRDALPVGFSSFTTSTPSIESKREASGNSRIRWIIMLLLFGLLIWYLFNEAENNTVDGNDPETADVMVEESNDKSTAGAEGEPDKIEVHYKNEDGHLEDEEGVVQHRSGSYKEDGGFYLDEDGNQIGVVSPNANESTESDTSEKKSFFNVFTDIFSRVDRGGMTYQLSRMEFHPEDHRLSYYSKAEIEGLVAALKTEPGARVQVRVYTDDGKNSSDNRKLSQMRANVVRDMMAILLEENKKQIDFKGMGDRDEQKAKEDAVLVYVED